MIKARLQLFVVMLVLLWGGSWVYFNAPLSIQGRLALEIPIVLLFLSAAVLFTITFFGLDAQKRIVEGSFAYRLLNSMGPKDAPLSGSIRLCPAYWRVCISLFLTTYAVVLISVFAFMAYSAIMGISKVSTEQVMEGSLGPGMFFLLIGMVVLGMRLFSAPLALTLWFSLTIFVFAFILGLFVECGKSALLSMVFFNAFISSSKFFGMLLIIVLAVACLVLLVGGIVWCALRVFSFAKDTIFGRMVAGLYNNMCIEIPIVSSKT